jgi:DNA-binding NarL/FixJ family response regulator
MSSHPKKTVYVEDQALFRDLLGRMLEVDDRFDVVASFAEAESALDYCIECPPEFLMVDIQLPQMDGIDLARMVMKRCPETRILALTTLTDRFTISRVIEAGIPGYVEKNRDLDVLLEAMTTVASGGRYQTDLVDNVKASFRGNSDAFNRILSPREQAIVTAVADGETSAEIASRLDISPRTVENHRYRIMKKLDLKDTAALIRYAIDQGYISPS